MIDYNGSIWAHRAELTVKHAVRTAIECQIPANHVERHVRLTPCPFGPRPGPGSGRVWAAALDAALGKRKKGRG